MENTLNTFEEVRAKLKLIYNKLSKFNRIDERFFDMRLDNEYNHLTLSFDLKRITISQILDTERIRVCTCKYDYNTIYTSIDIDKFDNPLQAYLYFTEISACVGYYSGKDNAFDVISEPFTYESFNTPYMVLKKIIAAYETRDQKKLDILRGFLLLFCEHYKRMESYNPRILENELVLESITNHGTIKIVVDLIEEKPEYKIVYGDTEEIVPINYFDVNVFAPLDKYFKLPFTLN